MDLTEPGLLISGRYRLVAVIGRGGMGTVWRGFDEVLNRDVAVKQVVWPPHFTERERQVACDRAIREAQMAGRLSHRNVVRVYDIAREDGCPWIVMEHLPYKSLHDLVAEQGPLSPARAAQVGLGVLAALRAAHAEGILHRDVKPANILVGRDGRVVLTDFGIARAADMPTLTTEGALLGSPSYIAPERARGGPSGEAADHWGLGASLYAAVEGRPPFNQAGAVATLTAVVSDVPDAPVNAGPLWPLIDGLLRKDPRARVGAAEAERMLRHVADAAAVRHPVQRPWRRKPSRVRRASLAAAPGALAVAQGGPGHETVAWQPAFSGSPPPGVTRARPAAPASAVTPEPAAPEVVAPERVAAEAVAPEAVRPEPVTSPAGIPAPPRRLAVAVALLCLIAVAATVALVLGSGSPDRRAAAPGNGADATTSASLTSVPARYPLTPG